MKLFALSVVLFFSYFSFSSMTFAMCTWQPRYCSEYNDESCYIGASNCVDHACNVDKFGQMRLYSLYDHEMTVKASAPRDYTKFDHDQCTELTESDYM